MNKYLNADDLILKIMANAANNPWILLTTKDTDLYHTVANTKALAEIINEMPSADVRENIHGKWKPERTRFGYYCNKCKMYSYWSTNFCPNCGADMRGLTDE